MSPKLSQPPRNVTTNGTAPVDLHRFPDATLSSCTGRSRSPWCRTSAGRRLLLFRFTAMVVVLVFGCCVVEAVKFGPDGIGVGVVMGVAEAVPGRRQSLVVAELLEQGEGLSAVDECLLVVTEFGVAPADPVEGTGLPRPVADSPVQVEGPQIVVESLGVAALPPSKVAQVVMGMGLPDQVAGLAVQVEGAPQVGVSVVVEATQPGVSVPQKAVGPGLRDWIAQPLGCGHGGPLDSGPVVPVALPIEEGVQRP